MKLILLESKTFDVECINQKRSLSSFATLFDFHRQEYTPELNPFFTNIVALYSL